MQIQHTTYSRESKVPANLDNGVQIRHTVEIISGEFRISSRLYVSFLLTNLTAKLLLNVGMTGDFEHHEAKAHRCCVVACKQQSPFERDMSDNGLSRCRYTIHTASEKSFPHLTSYLVHPLRYLLSLHKHSQEIIADEDISAPSKVRTSRLPFPTVNAFALSSINCLATPEAVEAVFRSCTSLGLEDWAVI